MTEARIKSKIGNNELLGLLAIIMAGLSVRFYYFPFEIPITLDGFRFFLYATDTMILGHLPTNYTLPNNGWSLFLSFFFSIFRFESFLDYVTLQRTLTVVCSVLTAVPIYLLCRKFFNQSLAIVGVALFIFSPRIIQNSLGGITDPLFVLLTTTTIFLFLNKNKTHTYISFFILALSALVRYESLLLIIPFSVLFLIRFRVEQKIILRYLMVLAIFVITLLPLAYLRIEATGQDGLLSHVLGGAKVTVTQGSILNEDQSKFSLQNGVFNLIRNVGVNLFPVFFVFIPYGAYVFLKKRDYNTNSLILIGIFMLVPALYAYGRGIHEPRYIFAVLPIASIISLYTIERIAKRKTILILILSAIILSSIFYLDYKKMDLAHEKDAILVATHIQSLSGMINEFSPESAYVETAALYKLRLPILSTDIDFGPKVIPFDGQSVEDGIQNGREKGLSYLVVDSQNTKSSRKSFLNDVFYHEEKYPYLTKVFDSREHGNNYHVKIFKIDYQKFDSLLKEK